LDLGDLLDSSFQKESNQRREKECTNKKKDISQQVDHSHTVPDISGDSAERTERESAAEAMQFKKKKKS